jgi:putative ABC transport system permease protein
MINEVEQAWMKVNPEKPFQFFLDSYFDQQYKADSTDTSLFIFSSFAIFIVCLGLCGLVADTDLQRTKEIGVRKVMCAFVRSILLLLSGDFVRLLVVATIITIPLIALGLGHGWNNMHLGLI